MDNIEIIKPEIVVLYVETPSRETTSKLEERRDWIAQNGGGN